jgi:hypothetical protein
MTDMGIQFGIHINADIVGGQYRLFARTAYRKLDRLERDPSYLVKDREYDGALAQAYFRAQEARAYESHIGWRALIDPNRDDVKDRDKDDRDDDDTDYDFKHRALAPFFEVLAIPLTSAVQPT